MMRDAEERALCGHVSQAMVPHHHSNEALSRGGEICQPYEYPLVSQGEAAGKLNGKRKYSDRAHDCHGHLHLLLSDAASEKKWEVVFVMTERTKIGYVPPPRKAQVKRILKPVMKDVNLM
jgi:hypothetical protein